MATFVDRKPCARCQKGGGVTTCDGCQQLFCIKHIVEHRQELATQMDHIGQEHDSLHRDLIQDQEESIHPLLLRINEWEQESIKKIQVAAETARGNLRQLLNQTKNDVKTSVGKVAHELQTYRESDDYTEIDLNRWSERLKEVRKLLEASSTIRIVEDDNISTVTRLIKVVEQQQLHLSSDHTQISEKSVLHPQKLFGSTQELFDKAMGSITLLDDGLVATYTSVFSYSYNTIFGKNLYGSGVHHIHFRIENKNGDNFFFGIVTSSEDIEGRIFNTPSANGWWGFDAPVINGISQQRCGEKILQTGDAVKLTLDCDNKRIRFENYRTQMILQSPIDITKCPFPWKIAASLSQPRDVLHILW